jgi:hypothetical protein
MPDPQIIKKLLDLMNSGSQRELSQIVFTDGTTEIGIPHGFHLYHGASYMDLFDVSGNSSEHIALEKVKDIITPVPSQN